MSTLIDAMYNNDVMTFQTSGTPIKIKEKITYSTGISFVPGIYLNNNTLLYLRAAAVFTKFKHKTADGGVWSAPIDFSTTRVGWRAGLGLQADMDDEVSIRVEYDYTYYSSFSASGTTPNFGGNTVVTNFKPRSHTALVGIVYRFGGGKAEAVKGAPFNKSEETKAA